MHDCPLTDRGRPRAAALDSLVASALEMVHWPRWRGASLRRWVDRRCPGTGDPICPNHRGMDGRLRLLQGGRGGAGNLDVNPYRRIRGPNLLNIEEVAGEIL